MKIRCPGHYTEMGDLFLLRAVHVHGKNLSAASIYGEPSPYDLFAIGAKKRSAVVAFRFCEATNTGPVSIHEIDIHHV